jgi:hypothetical protein
MMFGTEHRQVRRVFFSLAGVHINAHVFTMFTRPSSRLEIHGSRSDQNNTASIAH